MLGKSFTAKLSYIALTYALLIRLLPVSTHMLSMQTTRMDATMASYSQNGPVHEDMGDTASMPCCSVVNGLVSLACSFIVSEHSQFAIDGNSEPVGYLTPLFQSIYIKAASPPPKA